jgi:hypothetical protein
MPLLQSTVHGSATIQANAVGPLAALPISWNSAASVLESCSASTCSSALRFLRSPSSSSLSAHSALCRTAHTVRQRCAKPFRVLMVN